MMLSGGTDNGHLNHTMAKDISKLSGSQVGLNQELGEDPISVRANTEN